MKKAVLCSGIAVSVLAVLLGAACGYKQETHAARQSLEEPSAPVVAAATASAASPPREAADKKAKSAPLATMDDVPGIAIGGGGQAFASPIRAGEWDDNANYREFQRYIGKTGEPIHTVDVRARRFLVVRDIAGKAVSRCPVTVNDDAQHSVTLTTTASGRAILFPYAEGLTGKKFTASARCVEGNASTTVALDDDGDGTAEMHLNAARRNDARMIDLAFILDTTGSMSEEIASVKSTIQTVAKTLQSSQLQVRIGMIEYKDRSDPFVTKAYAFTNDLQAFSKKISGIEAGGGGDMPEDMNAGVHAGLTELEWSSQAVAKMAFIIADAPPHLDYPNDPDYALSMKTASHKGIQLFGVAASGMDGLGQAVMRQMAQYTGATEMFVLRGGAGPQSVGGGDPLSSCGGTQEQYASGNLDGLIVSKIKRELAALDADPSKIPGLRTDESAKPCNERFALKY
jgi:Mg-chelatase subunit ChlD